jgi:hypothetical protein
MFAGLFSAPVRLCSLRRLEANTSFHHDANSHGLALVIKGLVPCLTVASIS